MSGPSREIPPPNSSRPEGASGSKPDAAPNQEKPAWFKRLPGIGGLLSRGKPREALGATARLGEPEPPAPDTSTDPRLADASAGVEEPQQIAPDSTAAYPLGTKESSATGPVVSPESEQSGSPAVNPAAVTEEQGDNLPPAPQTSTVYPPIMALRDELKASMGVETPPGTVIGGPIERQPLETTGSSESEPLPWEEIIKEGRELSYVQLSPDALRGDLFEQSSLMLIINQQGQVIAYIEESKFNQDNWDRDTDEDYDLDAVRADVRRGLERRGLGSYAIVFENADIDGLDLQLHVDLDQLTGGSSIYDYRGINFGNKEYQDMMAGRVDVLDSRKGGVAELSLLVADPAFQERFVRVQTQAETEQLLGITQELNKAVEAQLKPLTEQAAMEALGVTDINAARRLGKAWGEALRGVSAVTIRDAQTERRVSIDEARTLLTTQLEPTFDQRRDEAQKSLVEAAQRQRQELAQLQQEIEARADDPELIEAMEVWGRSPDSQGHRGIDGTGLNAGVIHYFEYRADLAKNGRFKKAETELSIQGFIEYSRRIRALIDNPNPSTNPDVQTAGMIEDAQGQRRLFILTRDGDKIVGFMRSGEPMRVITVIPGSNEKAVQRDLTQELQADPNDPKETARLNHLGTGRHSIELPLSSETVEDDGKFRDFHSTIKQQTTRGDGILRLGEAFARGEIDFQQALDHLRIHTEGAVAGSQFNGAIFENPEQVRQLLGRILPESLQYDQYGRAELTLDITHPGSEPIGWTGVKSTAELEQSGGVIEKRMRIPGGVEDIVDGIKGAWYPEMVYDQTQGKMVVALDENGNVRNARGKFEPEVNVATVSQEEFQDTSKTNKLTVILQKDKLTGKPVVLTAFPGENAPPVPSRLNITVIEAGEQAETIDNLQDPIMKDYWEDHAFIQTS